MVKSLSGILLGHKKEQNNAICSNMDGTRDSHISEVSQQEKDKYHMTPHIWNLTYGKNEPIYRKETNSRTWRTDLWVTKRSGGRWSLGLVDANYCIWRE